MTPYEIPLSPEAQLFDIQLAGVNYKMRVYWGGDAACWMLDIFQSNGTPLVEAIAIVTGVNLLEQYAYLGFGGGLIAQTDHDADAVPTVNNLGLTGRLYFYVGA